MPHHNSPDIMPHTYSHGVAYPNAEVKTMVDKTFTALGDKWKLDGFFMVVEGTLKVYDFTFIPTEYNSISQHDANITMALASLIGGTWSVMYSKEDNTPVVHVRLYC